MLIMLDLLMISQQSTNNKNIYFEKNHMWFFYDTCDKSSQLVAIKTNLLRAMLQQREF